MNKLSLFHSAVATMSAVAVCSCAGAQVTVGGTGTSNVFPFSRNYSGQYQQVYSSSAFSGPVSIGSVAFESVAPGGSGAYSFTGTLGLASTTLTPAMPGTSYLATTQVFSGTQTATLTASGSAFDLIFNLATPFTYDPATGNLLLNVTTNSVSDPLPFAAFVFGSSTNVGRTFNFSGNGAPFAGADEGLLTRFGVTPATATPEFGTVFSLGGLLAAGGTGLWVNSRRRKNSRTVRT